MMLMIISIVQCKRERDSERERENEMMILEGGLWVLSTRKKAYNTVASLFPNGTVAFVVKMRYIVTSNVYAQVLKFTHNNNYYNITFALP